MTPGSIGRSYGLNSVPQEDAEVLSPSTCEGDYLEMGCLQMIKLR